MELIGFEEIQSQKSYKSQMPKRDKNLIYGVVNQVNIKSATSSYKSFLTPFCNQVSHRDADPAYCQMLS